MSIAELGKDAYSGIAVEDIGLLDASSGYFNTPGARLGTNFSAFGNRLFAVELDSGEVKEAALSLPNATSLAYVGGMLLAASAESIPTDSVERRFVIEAFNDGLELKWRYSSSFASEMMESDGITTLLTGEPVVRGATGDMQGIVVSAGRQAIVLDANSGTEKTRVNYDQTVVDAKPIGGSQDDPGLVVISNANGVVSSKDLLEGAQDAEGDSRRLVMPFPIRWAYIARCDTYDVLLVVPADATDRIVSFRTNWLRDAQSGADYSLDELIGTANEILSEGGRARTT